LKAGFRLFKVFLKYAYIMIFFDQPISSRFQLISKALRESKFTVSLLDCTLKNVTVLNEARIFENVSLHGLVISSGEIKRIHRSLFLGMKTPLQTLGLPNNALTYVPWNSMQPLMGLDRLDLSNNKIKSLGAPDFVVGFPRF
jgi:hypothetical protein